MLVLSRKIGEVITIGNTIKITILSYDRGIVRVGIEAPKDIPVHRKEVYDRIIELNRQATQVTPDALRNALGSLQQTHAPKQPNKEATPL
ncbi:MAG: carbon storage regulator CsrA [Bacteroidota bacterium]|nr:carbon storage regulator CsrA [Candidatus Kapabacteria bacterium]MCX7937034.1 carbon storage regulator CsrA [Chlorobiota bacterium]MDW8075505.1 carbon storage regulator CsrA [Bacteroidota bacterium]MDW8272362.1 carbon storage regulator CsrA [Bacteroidota bacterium]